MNTLTRIIRRAPRRLSALVAIVAAAIVVPATLHATWGPADRQTFTMEVPATHVTFNSMEKTPYGNELNFVQIRNFTDNGNFGEKVELTPGKEYEVKVYYHNNAADNFNGTNFDGPGVARGAYMRVMMPREVKAGETGVVHGFVGATNAKHLDKANPSKDHGKQVWDDAQLLNNTGSAITPQYVAGSAKITNQGASNGSALKIEDLTSDSGALLGFNKLDGTLPGCLKYAGYVTYRIKVPAPDFTMSKTVRKAGTTEWKESIRVKEGDTVEYQIIYKNTGTEKQNNVIVKDTLPQGVTYIAGSTKIVNKSNPDGKQLSDNLFSSTGINIGNYSPGSVAEVTFSVKVNASSKLPECGDNTLRNTATVTTENGSKSDTADIIVTKKCDEPEDKTKKVCEKDTGKIITIKGSDFDKNKHLPVEDCIKACDITTKTVVPIVRSQLGDRYTEDLSKCDDQPTPLPEELPETGIGSALMATLGLGSVVASSAYYIASRRDLGAL